MQVIRDPLGEHIFLEGEAEIREAYETWRRHLIEQWRAEELIMQQATPILDHPFKFHHIHFKNGVVGTFGYLGHEGKHVPLGCNLVSFPPDKDPTVPKLVMGFKSYFDPRWYKSGEAYFIKQQFNAVYDPILLLFSLLCYGEGLNFDQPISASEIVKLSEHYAERYEDEGLVRIVHYYPIELMEIAREHL